MGPQAQALPPVGGAPSCGFFLVPHGFFFRYSLDTAAAAADRPLPLQGLRVVEFSHMVMGPSCGMVLADLGAEVIKVEPVEGDRTRHLLGAARAFSPCSTATRRASPLTCAARRPAGRHPAGGIGRCGAAELQARGDEEIRAGLRHAEPAESGPDLREPHRLSAGPYEHRTALDEVVQMMGGLAYMTGRPGDPLRAGTSVNDIMGGMFGAIGAMAALMQRAQTGKGQEIDSALFENNVFLVGQHMMQYAVTGQAAAPMPDRISSWAMYDVFTVQDGEQIFLAAVSDAQWRTFCDAMGYDDLKADPQLTNNDRVRARSTMMPCCASGWPSIRRPRWRPSSSSTGCRLRPSPGPNSCSTTPPERHGLPGRCGADRWRARRTDGAHHAAAAAHGRPAPAGALQPPAVGEHTAVLLQGLGTGRTRLRSCNPPAPWPECCRGGCTMAPQE
jgi:crotonobetainyl-CoA:carnitine CoA-transferase CaiB-like acyl-CoA transferase